MRDAVSSSSGRKGSRGPPMGKPAASRATFTATMKFVDSVASRSGYTAAQAERAASRSPARTASYTATSCAGTMLAVPAMIPAEPDTSEHSARLSQPTKVPTRSE